MKTIDYQKQGTDFLEKTGTKMTVKFLYHGPHFEDDKQTRDVYEITLKRKGREYKFRFGQSVNHSGGADQATVWNHNWVPGDPIDRRFLARRIAPTPYDVLAAITNYNPGTFKDFCGEFGYDEDSRKAEKTYFAVQEEYCNIEHLFGDVMELLRAIE